MFATRSQDRPNPIGLHRVTIIAAIEGLRVLVRDLEAVDRTPIVDVKPAFRGGHLGLAGRLQGGRDDGRGLLEDPLQVVGPRKLSA